MAQHKPIRVGDSTILQQIDPATEEIDGKIYCSTNNIVLGRLTSGAGAHEEIDISDLPGVGGGWYAAGATASFNNTTVETDFFSVTVPADTLSEVGTCLDVEAWGQFTNNVGSNQNFTLRIYADGVEVFEDASGNIATNANPRVFKIRGKIVRLDASNAAASFEVLLGNLAASTPTGSGDLGGTALRVCPIICTSPFAWDFADDVIFKVTMQLGSASPSLSMTGHNYVVYLAGVAGGEWGTISGTLSDQTDLQTALDAKVDENSPISGDTKTKITYDSKGLVTAGEDAAIADITGLQTALDGKADSAHTHPLSDIEQSGASTNNVPKWNGSAWAPASDDKTFLDLTDTPASYSGEASKIVAVNAGETGVEFIDVPSGLPAGASANTLRHNGTDWVADTLLQNTGSEITIARANSTGTPLKVTIPISAVNYNILAHTYNTSGGQNSLLTVSSSTIGSNQGISVTNNNSNASASPRMQFIRRRGTLAAPSDAASGDLIGRFDFRVRNGGSDQAATTYFGGVFTDTTYNGASIFFATSTVDFNQLKFLAHTNGAIGIGNFGTPGAVSAPNASAALEIRSTVGSFLLPRMTTAERDALATPEDGMMVYNTTDNKFQGRASGAWVDLH